MSDLISRQEAIEYFVTNVGFHDEDGYSIDDSDELRKIWTEYFNVIPSAQPYTEEQIQKMQDVEQAQLEEVYRLGRESAQQWIPCSEKLPDPEAKIYWVCTDTGYQCQCRWTNINHIWTDLTIDWHWHIMDVSQYSEVVAWMSLPEPYEER